jgi:hypothetical protein
MIGVGPTGIFVSQDGLLWTRSTQEGFNAVATTKGAVIAVGENGTIAHAPLTSLVLPGVVD